jgi:hypothetical protein
MKGGCQLTVYDTPKIAEVIEASSTEFVAECYELYESPSLGSLIKTHDQSIELYGVIYNAATSSVEPGRRPIARGRDEATEEDIFRSSPQLSKLLRTEFSALVVGYRLEESTYHYLPPRPAHIHSFIYLCSPQEIKQFSQSFGFLNIMLGARLEVPVEEVIAACLRQMSQVYGEDRREFLVAAGKELAVLLSTDYNRLRAVLERIRMG